MNPANKDGYPLDPNFRLPQPAQYLSPAAAIAQTVDRARPQLPAVTTGGAPLNAPAIQLAPASSVPASVAECLVARQPSAPAILHKPASEQILKWLQMSVDQKKNALPEPHWYFEYLGRHLDEFQDLNLLKQLMLGLKPAVESGYLPPPGLQESMILSRLVSKVCCHAQNDPIFVDAFEKMTDLLLEFHRMTDSLEERILSPEAFTHMFSALKVLGSIQEYSDSRLVNLVSLANENFQGITTWDPEVVANLVFLMAEANKRSLSSMTHGFPNIPGFLEGVLTLGDSSAENRLSLYRMCLHCTKNGISSSDRERLHAILDENIHSIDSFIAQLESAGDHEAIKADTKAKILPLVYYFGSIASDVRLAPFANEGIARLAKLIEQLSSLSPTSFEIDIVVSGLSPLYQLVPCLELECLDKALIHLISAAVRNFDMHCVSRHSGCYKFLAHRNASRISSAIFIALLKSLQDVISVLSNDAFSDAERIAKAFYLSGLLADFPIKLDCSDAVAFALGSLVKPHMSKENVASCGLGEVIVKLLGHYASLPANEAVFGEDTFHILSGLAMMVCNQLFTHLPRPNSSMRQLLNKFHDLLEDELPRLDRGAIEILFWMGCLAGMCEKHPDLNPLLDGHDFRWADFHLKSLPSVSVGDACKALSGFGKLAVHNRIQHLSPEAKDRLMLLIPFYASKPYGGKGGEMMDDSEFLFILAHLYLKGLIGIECQTLQAPAYRPILLRSLQLHPPGSMEQASKILFFLDAVQPLQTGKDTGRPREKVEFAEYIKELKTQMENYLSRSRRDGTKVFDARKQQKNYIKENK